jgi:hypothetical protein
MSVLSSKREAEIADTRGRMRQLAWAAALARAAVPMAKTAGTAARDGTRRTAAWAAPRVNGARAWTAPRIERSGLAIRDTIAPKICDTLTATARRVDVTPPLVVNVTVRRRWPKVMAGTAVLAAAGAAAALVLRRRNNDKARETPGEAAETGTAPQAAQDGQLRAGAAGDGDGAKEDVSGQSQAT